MQRLHYFVVSAGAGVSAKEPVCRHSPSPMFESKLELDGLGLLWA